MQIWSTEYLTNRLHTASACAAAHGMNSCNLNGVRKVAAIAVLADQSCQGVCPTGEYGHHNVIMPHAKHISLRQLCFEIRCAFWNYPNVHWPYCQKHDSQADGGHMRQNVVDPARSDFHGIRAFAHSICRSIAIVQSSRQRAIVRLCDGPQLRGLKANTGGKVAGKLRVPSAESQKALFFLGLRYMECACHFG